MMNKIDKIAKRKELLEQGYLFDFKSSIDENGEVKSEEIWIKEKLIFYLQDNDFNSKSERFFDCFNERYKLKQYKKKCQVVQVDTEEKLNSHTFTLKNIAPFLFGFCYSGVKKVTLSDNIFIVEVIMSGDRADPFKWDVKDDWRKKMYQKWNNI